MGITAFIAAMLVTSAIVNAIQAWQMLKLERELDDLTNRCMRLEYERDSLRGTLPFRILRITRVLLLAVALSTSINAEPVYFAGGQSNASIQWRDAIASELPGQVAWLKHSGANMFWWIDADGQRNTNYIEDLAEIQATMQSRDTFAGLLWFQGEGDASFAITYQNWGSKFATMLDYYRQDLQIEDFGVVVMVIDLESPPNPLWLETVRDEQRHYPHADTRGYPRIDGVHVTTKAAGTLGHLAGKRLLTEYESCCSGTQVNEVPEFASWSWMLILLIRTRIRWGVRWQ